MEFRGQKLKDILTAQTENVDIQNWDGVFVSRVSGKDAVAIVGLEGFVGVGHKKRIRFVRPEGRSLRPWKRSNETLGSKGLVKAWRKEPEKHITPGGLVNPK